MEMILDIKEKLVNDIQDYCDANGIEDYNEFMCRMMRDGFMVELYGSTPFTSYKTDEPEPKEEKIDSPVIVEVVKPKGDTEKEPMGKIDDTPINNNVPEEPVEVEEPKKEESKPTKRRLK